MDERKLQMIYLLKLVGSNFKIVVVFTIFFVLLLRVSE